MLSDGSRSDARLQVGPSSPLGTIANFVDTSPSEAVFKRLRKWARQDAAVHALRSEGSFRRLCNCNRAPISCAAGVSVRRAVKGAQLCFYAGVQRCGSVWTCAICGSRITEVRRGELAQLFSKVDDGGGSSGLLTLTFSHRSGDSLASLVEAQGQALHYLRDSRAWRSLKSRGLMGTVRGSEFTVSTLNGWHPHTHTTLHFASPVFPADLHALLLPAWRAALTRVGLTCSDERGVHVEASKGALTDYLAKWGHEPVKGAWGPEDEMTRGISKVGRSAHWSPFQLLDNFIATGEALYRTLFVEYSLATRGRSQLRYSPGLRLLVGLLPELSDEDIVSADEPSTLVCPPFEPMVWRWILAHRGEVLEAANRGGFDAVEAFIMARAAHAS